MDVEYFVFGALAVFIVACCLADLGRRATLLELTMKEQIKRSSETVRGALLD